MSGMNPAQRSAMLGVLREVRGERYRQHAKWGEQNDPDGTGQAITLPRVSSTAEVAIWAKGRTDALMARGACTYEAILTEEWAEALAESDPAQLRTELIQVAAVAVAWVEAIDRRAQSGDPESGEVQR